MTNSKVTKADLQSIGEFLVNRRHDFGASAPVVVHLQGDAFPTFPAKVDPMVALARQARLLHDRPWSRPLSEVSAFEWCMTATIVNRKPLW